MEIQQRILRFVLWSNWILFGTASLLGLALAPAGITRGIVFGGLIVNINFHLLYRTLRGALTPPHLTAYPVVLAKYYLRFIASGFILFVLIWGRFVDPRGLFIGLSIVVASIMAATVFELKKLIFKEAV